MSGDKAAVESLLGHGSSESNQSANAKAIARLIVHMAPELAKQKIKELDERVPFRKDLIEAAQGFFSVEEHDNN